MIRVVALILTLFSIQASSKNYVFIIAGQSNANGRAPIDTVVASAESKSFLVGLEEKIRSHVFARTKVWIDPDDSIRKSWPGYGAPIKGYTPRITPGWEPYNVAYNQCYQCGWMVADDGTLHATHGIEPEIAYSFETDPRHKNDNLYIIKWAYGGIGLAKSLHEVDWNVFSDHKMYYYFVNNYLNPAFNSPELQHYESLGFWWSQGENDSLNSADANEYGTNLNEFFLSLHNDVPQTKLFKNYIQKIELDFRIGGKYADTVRRKQAEFCINKDNNCTLIDVDEFDFLLQNHDQTYVHLSSIGFHQINNVLYPLLTL